MPVRLILQEIMKPLGFRGPRDLLESAYGIKLYTGTVLMIQLSGTAVATVVAFCAEWVWDPPRALLLLLVLDILNGIYGWKADVKLNGGGFSWEKGQRTAGKIVATVILLFCCRQAIASYEYYKWLADAIFGWLFTQKLRKLAIKMAALKVQESGLPKIIRGAVSAILTSKYGDGLVDSIQQRAPVSPEPTTPANVEETPAPPSSQEASPGQTPAT